MADRWCRPTRAHAGLVLDGALPVPENAARIAAWLRQRAGSGGA